MSSKDSTAGRSKKSDAGASQADDSTPMAFYIFMGSIGAAIIYFLIMLLFL